LQTEGLLVDEPNRRLCVSPLTTDDLNALYSMRIVLEPLAVRLTVPRLVDTDLDALKSALHAIEGAAAAGDYEATRSPHRTFHELLFSKVKGRLLQQVREARDHADRYRRLLFTGASDSIAMLAVSAEVHHAIADAAFARDANQCAELVADHLTRVALFSFAQLEGTFEPSDVRAALEFTRFGTAGPRAESRRAA
jgi:DNA-binding GntR family transcriptional regulator